MSSFSKKLAKHYLVPDLIINNKEVRVVFLLESPFTDELFLGHPLAGKSGRTVTRFLSSHLNCFSSWNKKVPFGCHLSMNKCTNIAIMNCSNLPLDKSVYCPRDYKNERTKIDALNFIRNNPIASSRRNKYISDVEKEIVDDLAIRISQLPNDIFIFPFGVFAQNFAKKASLRNYYTKKLPHPSRNQWGNQNNFEDFEDFLSKLHKYLGS